MSMTCLQMRAVIFHQPYCFGNYAMCFTKTRRFRQLSINYRMNWIKEQGAPSVAKLLTPRLLFFCCFCAVEEILSLEERHYTV